MDPHLTVEKLNDDATCSLCGKPRTGLIVCGILLHLPCPDCSREKPELVHEHETDVALVRAEHDRWLIDTPQGQHRLGIPPQYHGASLDDFNPHVGNMLMAFLVDSVGGLLTISGPCGIGKTRLLYACARNLQANGLAWRKLSVPQLVIHLQALSGDSMSNAELEIQELQDFQGLLMLDDLGAEKTTDFVVQSLYVILASREEWRRSTIITTNLELDGIAKRFSNRIASRLAGGRQLVLSGRDRRLAKEKI